MVTHEAESIARQPNGSLPKRGDENSFWSFRSFDGYGVWSTPLSWLFGSLVNMRLWLYSWGVLRCRSSGLKVLCVGGLEVGGSGKTPVTRFLLRALISAGHKPALLTRGYNRASRDPVFRRPGETIEPDQVGDEVALLLQDLDIAVMVDADRLQGARRLKKDGYGLAIMDDGFSHRRLFRSLDLVVLRGEKPFGNGAFLPRGTLREPPRSLSRAHVVWLHFGEQVPPELPSWLLDYCPDAHPVLSRRRPRWLGEAPSLGEGHEKLLVVTGIARPESLWRSACCMNLPVCDLMTFPDHHRYSLKDLRAIEKRALEKGAGGILTTGKDWVKMGTGALGLKTYVLDTDVEVVSGLTGLAKLLGLKEEDFSMSA
jgi:tetraacyldisaccharide 4'-kinase